MKDNHNKKTIKEIAQKIEDEYEMHGLTEGVYLDFVIDVAIWYYEYKNKIKKVWKLLSNK